MSYFSELVLSKKIQFLMKIYKSWLRKGSRVLVVGCGDGIVTDELARYFSLTVVGCDIDKYLDRDIAYVHMKNKNKLPFKPNSFDTALFTDVLHHTSKDIQEDLVVEAIRVAREKVIIFELKPTIGNHLLDCVVNKIYHPTMETPR